MVNPLFGDDEQKALNFLFEQIIGKLKQLDGVRSILIPIYLILIYLNIQHNTL